MSIPSQIVRSLHFSFSHTSLSMFRNSFYVQWLIDFRHETTSTALVWALWELSEHPEIQSRLRKEIHSVLGREFDAMKPPTNEQIEQMKFLNNVVREVLRVNPPGIIPDFYLPCLIRYIIISLLFPSFIANTLPFIPFLLLLPSFLFHISFFVHSSPPSFSNHLSSPY